MKKIFAAAAAVLLCFSAACSSGPDAGVLLREARSNAAALKSCRAVSVSTLEFTADGASHSFRSQTDLTYTASPFAVHSSVTMNSDGSAGSSETYTVTENGALSFYSRTDAGWQKSDAGALDTSPSAQISPLRLLDEAEDQKFVRSVKLGSRDAQKLELKLKSEVLRDSVQNIVTASGMGGSSTVVQALLDGAPAVYGYCYTDAKTGVPLRLEVDTADVLNRIFQNIDGGSVKVSVTACSLSADLSDIDAAPAVSLPEEAGSASSVQAKG